MAKTKRKKGSASTIIWIVILIAGVLVMEYPTISNWWNTRNQKEIVSHYDNQVHTMTEEEKEAFFQEAYDYNKQIAKVGAPFKNCDKVPGYDDILNPSGSGAMGYVTIPQINIELPIYHGTSADVLNVAAGHLKGSAFPVGGEGTNAVISAHRGLPSAKLFSDLDKLVVGDRFTITVLDRVFTYEVSEILTITPDNVKELYPIGDKDLVTLMTCTPYGVNTHRLLIRSERVETLELRKDVMVAADSIVVDPMIVIPIILAPMIIVLVIYWMAGSKPKHFDVKKFLNSHKE